MTEGKGAVSAQQIQDAERDAERLAYMVSWRERYIRRLEALLQGHEERAMLDLALLALCLRALAGREAEITHTREREGDVLHIPRALLRRVMADCPAAVESDEAECRIILAPDDVCPPEMADGGETA